MVSFLRLQSKNIKKASILLITLALLLVYPPRIDVLAYDRDEHDDDIERVLFGDENYKETHAPIKSKIQAIEDATYLCVDQYNQSGKKELENLKSRGIPDLPESINEFAFTSNYAHRRYTHRGWNVNYSEKSHWDVRKKILYNTVEHELFSVMKTPFSWFPWLNEKIYAESNKEKCENFCILLYYIHVLGDHSYAKGPAALAYVAPLSNEHDRDNPGIIPDLIKCFKVLFEDQQKTFTYKAFMLELEALQDVSENLISSTGGIDTEEKFKEYQKCANDLLDLMADDVPRLLKQEVFFQSFYIEE